MAVQDAKKLNFRGRVRQDACQKGPKTLDVTHWTITSSKEPPRLRFTNQWAEGHNYSNSNNDKDNDMQPKVTWVSWAFCECGQNEAKNVSTDVRKSIIGIE